MTTKKYVVEVLDELASRAYGVFVRTTVRFDNIKDAESFSFWARAHHYTVKFHTGKMEHKMSAEEIKMMSMLLAWWRKDTK